MANMLCPKCGKFQGKAEVCSSCGIIVAKFETKSTQQSSEPTNQKSIDRSSSTKDQNIGSQAIWNDSEKGTISLVLLGILFIVYQIFAYMWDGITESYDTVIEGSLIIWLFLKLAIMAALVFGVTAYRYQNWTTTDAAEIATFAWVVISMFQVSVFGCPSIILLIAIPFFPFIFGATVGHNIGRLHWPYRRGG